MQNACFGWRLSTFGCAMAISAPELCEACESGDLAAVQALVRGGVAIHARRDNAFNLACQNGHWAVARWLLGVDPHYAQWPAASMANLKKWSAERGGWMRSVVRVFRDVGGA